MIRCTEIDIDKSSLPVALPADVVLLSQFVEAPDALLASVERLCRQSPLRRMRTPGGRWMSAAMSNCGPLGWISDEAGYRYSAVDPLSGQPWPEMPGEFATLANRASLSAGFGEFQPDACLINCYRDRAQMGAHRDADERDYTQPIVSVSLGCPATFLWFGASRALRPIRWLLNPGDVLVWGRSARKGYHGVQRPQGGVRYNLTFRKAC